MNKKSKIMLITLIGLTISIAIAVWMRTFTFIGLDAEKECFRSTEWFSTASEALNWAISEAPDRVETYSKFLYYDGYDITRHEIIVQPNKENPFGGYDVIIIFYGKEEVTESPHVQVPNIVTYHSGESFPITHFHAVEWYILTYKYSGDTFQTVNYGKLCLTNQTDIKMMVWISTLYVNEDLVCMEFQFTVPSHQIGEQNLTITLYDEQYFKIFTETHQVVVVKCSDGAW